MRKTLSIFFYHYFSIYFKKHLNMKLYEEQNYPNFLDFSPLKVDDVYNTVTKIKLRFPQIRDKSVEQRNLPTFVKAFYHYLYNNEYKIPTQDEFVPYYMEYNKKYFDSYKPSKEKIDAVHARIRRAYPSIIRDLHFTLLLKEKTDLNIRFNTKLDINEGIDVLIEKDKQYYGLRLYVSTDISNAYVDKKDFRHTLFQNVKYIKHPLVKTSDKLHGDIYLYDENDVKKVLENLCN